MNPLIRDRCNVRVASTADEEGPSAPSLLSGVKWTYSAKQPTLAWNVGFAPESGRPLSGRCLSPFLTEVYPKWVRLVILRISTTIKRLFYREFPTRAWRVTRPLEQQGGLRLAISIHISRSWFRIPSPGSAVTAGHLENRTDFTAVSFGDPTKGLAPLPLPQSINPKVVNAVLLFPFATDVQADRSDGP